MEFKATYNNFDTEVLSSKEPVLVDFWATWCGPCRMETAAIQTLLEKHPEVKVAKVNVDEEGALAQDYHIMSIPTLLLIQNGEIANESVGYLGVEELEAFLGL